MTEILNHDELGEIQVDYHRAKHEDQEPYGDGSAARYTFFTDITCVTLEDGTFLEDGEIPVDLHSWIWGQL